MSNDSDNRPDSSGSSLSDDLAERLSGMSESELRAVISHAESLLPRPPTVADLLEAHPGEEILDVEERDGYTKVVKRQPCAQGCEECPHGPYLYHVRVEKHPEDGAGPSLHWEFVGLVK